MGRPKKISTEKKEVRLTTVRITRDYQDMTLNRKVKFQEEFKVSQQRAKELINAKVAEIVEIKK